LPWKSIARAQIFGEILVDEDIAAPRLRAGDKTALRPLPQFFRMHEQELGSLRDVHGFHEEAAFTWCGIARGRFAADIDRWKPHLSFASRK